MSITNFEFFFIVCCSCGFPLLLGGLIVLVIWLVKRGNRKPATPQAPAVATPAPAVIEVTPAAEIEKPVLSIEPTPAAPNENTAALEQLRQLKATLDAGEISIEEYESRVGEILNQL